MLSLFICISASANAKHCYIQYDNKSCATCHERVSLNTAYKCGWCNSLATCFYGDVNGPLNNECKSKDWVFDKTCPDEHPKEASMYNAMFIAIIVMLIILLIALTSVLWYTLHGVNESKIPEFDEVLLATYESN